MTSLRVARTTCMIMLFYTVKVIKIKKKCDIFSHYATCVALDNGDFQRQTIIGVVCV